MKDRNKIRTTYPVRKIPFVPNAVRDIPFSPRPVKSPYQLRLEDEKKASPRLTTKKDPITRYEKVCRKLLDMGEAPNTVEQIPSWVKALIDKCNRLEAENSGLGAASRARATNT